MKRRAVRYSLFVLALLPAAFAMVLASRSSERGSVLRSASTAFESMVNLEAVGMDDGYFYWNELYYAVESGKIDVAREYLQDILDVYPAVTRADIEQGSAPRESFQIDLEGNELLLRFAIKDDFGAMRIPDKRGVVAVDPQKIIDMVQGREHITIVPEGGHELAFGVRGEFRQPVLDAGDMLIILFASLALSLPLSMWLYRRSIVFYETRGLESIIFLFEQSERLSATHSRKVAALAVFLGEKMGYRRARLRNLYTAALLHDIGKISVPPALLLKRGELTETETREVQSHPMVSAKILRNFRELAHLAPFVLYHHERMDGSGYPEGISGTRIPQEARIIAVVDVFEALAGERTYRSPATPAESFAIMHRMALDQGIVSVFERSYPEFADYSPPRWTLGFSHARDRA